MGVSVRIDPIERDLALFFGEDLSPEGRSQALAEFAAEQLADAQATNRAAGGGQTPRHETFVDGRKGAPLASVRPDGTIVFEFDLVVDMLRWIWEMLKKHSPVRSGKFQNSHILFADGFEVKEPAAIPTASSYVFLNVQPYARKIERGLSSQATEGVYEVVETLAHQRFGNVAKSRFTYQAFREGNLEAYVGSRVRIAGAMRGGRMGERDAKRVAAIAQRQQRERRQPAIIVRTD